MYIANPPSNTCQDGTPRGGMGRGPVLEGGTCTLSLAESSTPCNHSPHLLSGVAVVLPISSTVGLAGESSNSVVRSPSPSCAYYLFNSLVFPPVPSPPGARYSCSNSLPYASMVRGQCTAHPLYCILDPLMFLSISH